MSTINEFFTVIHIGKCGGSTVTRFLKDNNIRHATTHMQQVPFDHRKKYVIVIRNPIRRFISAFQWRYRLVVEDKSQASRFSGERAALLRYGSVNQLAENIASFNSYIHHIKEDIHFHLHAFLKSCDRSNILGVITTEHMDADIKRLFGASAQVGHEKKNNSGAITLSPLGYDNLKKYLKKDYECIEQLNAMGCLTPEQYAVASS